MYTFFQKTDVFNNILQYDPQWHKYTVDGKPTFAITKLVGTIKEPFDAEKIAPFSVKKYNEEHQTNITSDELQAIWGAKNLISSEKGNAFHEFIEHSLANKRYDYPVSHVNDVFAGNKKVGDRDIFLPENVKKLYGAYKDKANKTFVDGKYGNKTVKEFFSMPALAYEFNNPVELLKESHDTITDQARQFLNDIKGKMYPVKSEMVIGSPKYQVVGTIDQLFYNVKSGKFEIWDWKTNSDFTYDDALCKYKMLAPYDYIKATNFNEYCLQLACYKIVFREMTGIELGNSYLCWFSEKEPKYKVFKCKEYEKEAMELLEKAKSLIPPPKPWEIR